MQFLLKSYKAQAVIFLYIWIVSMVLSAEFILSIAMIGLLVLALFQMELDGPKINIRWRDNLKENFQKYKAYRPWLWVSVPFLIVLITSIYSSDWDYTLGRLQIKLPFLVLPFAFASMPKLGKKEIYATFYFLLFSMLIASLYVGANYVANFEEINDLIDKGQPMPTPSNHIRFSLTLAFTIIAGIALWWDNFYFNSPKERYFIGFATLFLFVFIHVLSVRSGILAAYIALFVVAVQYGFRHKKYLLIGGMVLALGTIPVTAYYTIPSFQTKINYAKWDVQQYLEGKGKFYSDSERLLSLEIGWKIAKANPILGVGAGDLKKEVYAVYDSPEFEGIWNRKKMPHNQFLSIWAGAGILGLLLFIIAFFYPLFYKNNYRNPLFLALHAIIFMSFLMENTIENNFGISLYLLFLLLGLNYLNAKTAEH